MNNLNPLVPDYIKEMAILFADEMAKVDGFSKDSPDWKVHYRTFITQAVKESMIPKDHNPSRKVQIGEDDYIYEELLGESGLFPRSKSTVPKQKYLDNQDRAQLLTAVTLLSQLYMKKVYGAKLHRKGGISDFEFAQMGKDASPDVKAKYAKETFLHQYRRAFVFSLIMGAVTTIFGMKKAELDSITMGIEKLSPKELKIVDFRVSFMWYAYETAKLVFGYSPFSKRIAIAGQLVQQEAESVGAASIRHLVENRSLMSRVISTLRRKYDTVLLKDSKAIVPK